MTATQIKIAKSRLTALRKLVLESGSHEEFSKGVCAMEAVAWLANLPAITTAKALEEAAKPDSAPSSAAYSAADSAARSAASLAADSALASTVAEVQLSAQDLVRRMCAVTSASVKGWSWDAAAHTKGVAK